jgi:hypothetical protein
VISVQPVFRQSCDNANVHKRPATVILMSLALWLGATALPLPLAAQDEASDDVERQDEAFRRRMELEDARNRDRTFADTTYEKQVTQEKIDKLPQESRENIRRQLVDVIVENGEWEPKDALEKFPYEPSEAARGDPNLAQQEQEAWDEQIQKYHEREAEAFGSYRGPVPGPGNPGGQQGQGDSQQDGSSQSEAGSAGASGASGSQAQRGTYQPGSSQSESSAEEISTAGVSESALDFLLGQSGQAGTSTVTPAPPSASPPTSPAGEVSESQPEATGETRRGIIAITDLDKLEGAGGAVIPPPEESEEDEP